MLALAHDVGVAVVAEGVETPEQLEALRRLGCPRVQGCYLGRPVPEAPLPARPSAAPRPVPTPRSRSLDR